MDKATVFQTIQNAGLPKQEIANRIYLATVEGVSGANQDKGYGFMLSAIAELWNIRGTIGNPSGRTKITGRYRGMGVTKAMILDIIFQYPDGLNGNTPLFDDLLGVGFSGRSVGGNQGESTDSGSGQSGSNAFGVLMIVLFVILKFFLKFGWIASIIGTLILGSLIVMLIATRWKR